MVAFQEWWEKNVCNYLWILQRDMKHLCLTDLSTLSMFAVFFSLVFVLVDPKQIEFGVLQEFFIGYQQARLGSIHKNNKILILIYLTYVLAYIFIYTSIMCQHLRTLHQK